MAETTREIWFRDENCREYGPDNRVIERRKWRKIPIVKVTKTHLHLGRPVWKGKTVKAVPINADTSYGPYADFAMTNQEMEDKVFISENRIEASEKVRDCRDASVLRAILEILNGQS